MGFREQMYPNTLTAWRKEPDGRSVRWEPRGQMRCRWEGQRGANRSTSGDASADRALIIVPSCSVTPPLITEDRVALGKIDAPEPPADALAVTSHAGYWLAVDSHPDHWEVEAQ